MHVSDIELTKLRDFQPTSLDCKGLGADEDNGDWLVCPVVYHPNIAGILETSNWESMLVALAEADDCDGPEATFDTMRFGHWATPFQIAIVKPGSKAHRQAQEIAASLADYPVLDEEDHSRREYDAQHEAIDDELRALDFGDADTGELCHQVWEWLWKHFQRALEVSDEGCRLTRDNVEWALAGLGWDKNAEDAYAKNNA